MTLYTIGHSTHPLPEFIALLKAHAILQVADVRRYPASRRVPWFNSDELARALARAGLGYVHIASLGGRRPPAKNSPNQGWKNTAFRGYADYMAGPEFQAGMEQLLALAAWAPAALMCAEALPWRCHRNLISDALVARGVEVLHILGKTAQPHRLTAFAVVEDAGSGPPRLLYPGSAQQELGL